MSVRTAEERDVASIGLVHVRSWQAAYRGHFPDDFLDQMDPVRWSARWTRYFREGPGERERLLVSEDQGVVVGFANLGPCRDDGEEAGELRAIYLEPGHWGRGFGRELMDAAVHGLSKLGFDDAMLWALDADTRARRFYQAAGWRDDGGRREVNLFGFPIPEVRHRVNFA